MRLPLVPPMLARGRSAAVVAPHHLAAAAGLGILRQGGTAVDAAIATNAVLAVVAGNSCGIGGDAFWLIWDADGDGDLLALNGSGRAPAAADPSRLRRDGHRTMPRRGPHSVTVPGAVRSWGDAHRRFGRLSRTTILAPAIELARGGFPAWEGFIEAVEVTAPQVARTLGPAAPWFALYRPAGRPWRPGELVVLPALGATLERLADAGFDEFYEGEVATRQAEGLAAAGSSITIDDLRDHTSTWAQPISIAYRGVTAATHPPNSSGVVALEVLGILERFDPPAGDVFEGGHGPDGRWLHLLVEATKLALVDRDARLTDPEHSGGAVEQLLDPGRLDELAASIDRWRASAPPASRQPVGGGTVYLAAVDGEGNTVSLIQSNYSGFGSGLADPATGIHYQNRGSYFSLDLRHPNVLAPRKRTLHTLLPGMLFRDGRPWVVLGSMGGDAQPAIHAQVVSGLVDGGLDIAAAIAAPRISAEPADHFEPPDIVRAEPRFRAGLLEQLEAMGHHVVRTDPFDSRLGHCHAIELVDGGPAVGGSLAAATDPRSEGLPATW